MLQLKVLGLDPKDKRPVRKYSLGMKQRLELPCFLSSRGFNWLLTSQQTPDEDGVHMLTELIVEQRDRGAPLWPASHDAEFLRLSAMYFTNEVSVKLSRKSTCKDAS